MVSSFHTGIEPVRSVIADFLTPAMALSMSHSNKVMARTPLLRQTIAVGRATPCSVLTRDGVRCADRWEYRDTSCADYCFSSYEPLYRQFEIVLRSEAGRIAGVPAALATPTSDQPAGGCLELQLELPVGGKKLTLTVARKANDAPGHVSLVARHFTSLYDRPRLSGGEMPLPAAAKYAAALFQSWMSGPHKIARRWSLRRTAVLPADSDPLPNVASQPLSHVRVHVSVANNVPVTIEIPFCTLTTQKANATKMTSLTVDGVSKWLSYEKQAETHADWLRRMQAEGKLD